VPQGGDIIYASDVAGPPSVQAVDGANQASITNTTALPGSPICGVVITAPRSGRIRLTVGGRPTVISGTGVDLILGAVLKTGDVLGQGAVVHDGVLGDPGCKIDVVGGAGAAVTASSSLMISGLTPGALYNACCYHQISGTSPVGQIYNRWVSADALP
jgi:hypothetical protein